MTNVHKIEYPRYAFLADLSWFEGIRFFGVWNKAIKHQEKARKTFEQLMTLPEHRQLNSVYHAVNCHQLTEEDARTQEQRVLRVDKRIDQILHAGEYPGLDFAFDWGGLHLVARPTGVIEDLCYHFVSTHKGKNGKNWNERFGMTHRLAHAEAHLLGQDEVITICTHAIMAKKRSYRKPRMSRWVAAFLNMMKSSCKGLLVNFN